MSAGRDLSVCTGFSGPLRQILVDVPALIVFLIGLEGTLDRLLISDEHQL